MKNRKLLLIVSLVLALTMSLGGTLAYLTDTDADVNVMTLGSVTITQNEHQRVKGENGYETKEIDGVTSYVLEVYENDKPLLPTTEINADGTPINYGAGNWDDIIVRMTQIGSYGGMQVFESENAADKFVTVTNTGKTDAYVRTIVAVEVGTSDKNLVRTSYHTTWKEIPFAKVEIKGNFYNVYEYVYQGGQLSDGSWRHGKGILPAGDTTYPSLAQVYLKSEADNQDMIDLDGNKNGKLDILVLSQAIQANGFDDAATALKAGFGEVTEANVQKWFGETAVGTPGDKWPNNDTPVIADITVTNNEELAKALADGYAKIKLAAGNYTFPAASAFTGDEVLVCEDDVVFDGTSKLNIKGATVIGATFNNPTGTAADQTINGTFKNCTFTGVNGLRWCYAGETVVFENCVFSGSTYGIHFDGGANDVVFKNCTFSGFNAMAGAITKLTMEGCTFKPNGKSAYNGINLWGNTDMVDCTFIFDGSVDNEWIDLCTGNLTCTFTNCKVSDGVTERALTKDDVGNDGDNNTITVK